MKIVKASRQNKVDTRDIVCDKIKDCISTITASTDVQANWAKNSIADLAVVLSDIQASKEQ